MNPRHRFTVRVILISPGNRFLMFHSRFDPEAELPPRWILPGGGVEPGETLTQAAVRELWEETGKTFNEPALGAVFRSCQFVQEWQGGEHDTGEAHFFACSIPAEFVPDPMNWTEDEIRDTIEHRWFSFEELVESGYWAGPDGVIEVLGEWFSEA